MKKISYLIVSISILSITLIVSSCRKETHTKESIPTVVFLSPAENASFNEGDTIWIKALLSSETSLHDYQVAVKNITENKDAYTYAGHSHESSAITDLYFIPEVNRDADMQLSVTLLDHNGNKIEKLLPFRVLNVIVLPKPVISITSPKATLYHNGELITITASILHSAELKSAQLLLTRNSNTVLSFPLNVAGKKELTIDTTYEININEHSDFSLTITATDSLNSTGIQKLDFHAHP